MSSRGETHLDLKRTANRWATRHNFDGVNNMSYFPCTIHRLLKPIRINIYCFAISQLNFVYSGFPARPQTQYP